MSTYIFSVVVKIGSKKKISKKQINEVMELAIIDDEFVILTLEQELNIPAAQIEVELKQCQTQP